MTKNIRRFSSALCLTVILSAAPAIAAPSRDNSFDRERAPIVRILKRIAKFFGLTPTSEMPVGPVPAPTPGPTEP